MNVDSVLLSDAHRSGKCLFLLRYWNSPAVLWRTVHQCSDEGSIHHLIRMLKNTHLDLTGKGQWKVSKGALPRHPLFLSPECTTVNNWCWPKGLPLSDLEVGSTTCSCLKRPRRTHCRFHLVRLYSKMGRSTLTLTYWTTPASSVMCWRTSKFRKSFHILTAQGQKVAQSHFFAPQITTTLWLSGLFGELVVLQCLCVSTHSHLSKPCFFSLCQVNDHPLFWNQQQSDKPTNKPPVPSPSPVNNYLFCLKISSVTKICTQPRTNPNNQSFCLVQVNWKTKPTTKPT